jgi:hypothetical protein
MNTRLRFVDEIVPLAPHDLYRVLAAGTTRIGGDRGQARLSEAAHASQVAPALSREPYLRGPAASRADSTISARCTRRVTDAFKTNQALIVSSSRHTNPRRWMEGDGGITMNPNPQRHPALHETIMEEHLRELFESRSLVSPPRTGSSGVWLVRLALWKRPGKTYSRQRGDREGRRTRRCMVRHHLSRAHRLA